MKPVQFGHFTIELDACILEFFFIALELLLCLFHLIFMAVLCSPVVESMFYTFATA